MNSNLIFYSSIKSRRAVPSVLDTEKFALVHAMQQNKYTRWFEGNTTKISKINNPKR